MANDALTESPAPQSERHDVFVSYASEDKDVVRELVQRLKSNGIAVWFDEHLRGGDVLLEEIEKQIAGSRHFLACLSKHYENSDWTKHELDFARTLGVTTRRRKVICVRLDHHPVPENISPYKWRTWWEKHDAELSGLVSDFVPEHPHGLTSGPLGSVVKPEDSPVSRVEWGSESGQRPIPVILAGCGYWARKRTILPLLKAKPGLFEIFAITSLYPHEKDDGTKYESPKQEYDAILKELTPLLLDAPPPKLFSPSNIRLATPIEKIRTKVGFPSDAPLCVLINTPNVEHARLTLDAIDAQCHVYSERPAIAVHEEGEGDEPSLDDIVATANRKNVVFCTGVQRRLEPAYRYLSQHVGTPEFGLLTAIRCKLSSGRKLGGWRREPSQIGCGILMDEGYHLLDSAMWLLTCAFPRIDTSTLKCAVNRAMLLVGPPHNPSLRVPTSASGSVLLTFREGKRDRAVWLHFDLTYDASPRSVFECLELFSQTRSFLRLYRDQPDRYPPRPGKVQYVRASVPDVGLSGPPNGDAQTQIWDSSLDFQDGGYVPVQASDSPPNYGPLLEFFTRVQEFSIVRSLSSMASGTCDASQIVSTQRLIVEIVKGAEWIDHAGKSVRSQA